MSTTPPGPQPDRAVTLPVGKLRAAFLAGLFDKHVTLDERVVLGPRVGEDAAVIDMGDRYLVATTDPTPKNVPWAKAVSTRAAISSA